MTVQHEPCPECGSKDNLARYEDGHAYCFGCEYYEHADGTKREQNESPSKPFDYIEGEYKPLLKRKIREDTCRKYGYKLGRVGSGAVQLCDVRLADGRLVAQKVRTPSKDFWLNGSLDETPLIGMHLFSGGKTLIIAEGELDMLSWSQTQGNKYPVVSIPNGAKSAKKAIASNLDYINGFETVYLSFDMDEPGQDAAEEAAKLLLHKDVRIVKLPLKDANEMLMADRSGELTSAFWGAQPYRPDGLVKLSDLRQKVLEPPKKGKPWFLPTLTEFTYGRRYGDVYFVGAGTGVGKTDLFTQQMAFDVEVLNEPIGVFYLEQPPEETVKRFLGKIKKKTFHVFDGSWEPKELEDAYNEYENDDRVTFFDSFGVTEYDYIRQHIIYLQALGVRHIYIDHLTALATGSEKDEKVELEKITADLASLAKRYGLILHVISHLTTPDKGPSHEEGGRVTIRQFKGSRAIGFWGHFLFGMERNQQASTAEERQTTTFRVLKDRFTGRATGLTIPMNYDATTGMLYEKAKDSDEDFGFEEDETSFDFEEK